MADAMENYDYDIEPIRRYTYADYLKWDNTERRQLINGEIFMMASPSVVHQRIQRKLLVKFDHWLGGKPCEVFAAPLDVRLFPKDDLSDKTVVQPDLMVVCKKEKLAKNSVNGAPDFVAEIVSPSNTLKEMLYKFQYYQQSGVREYWIVDPDEKKVQVNLFDGNHTTTSYFLEDESISVNILPGLEIDLKEIWDS